jgi:hypothetical protein
MPIKPASRHQQRNRGNLLVMTAIVGGMLFLVLAFGLLVSAFFFAQKRVQQQADRMAVSIAKRLNEGDRIGQINNLVERSRELVFVSRHNVSDANERLVHIEPLARQMLEESRTGAQLVEAERTAIARSISEDVMAEADIQNKENAKAMQVNLPFMRTFPARLHSLELGYVEDVESNALLPEGIPDLKNYDLSCNFARQESSLYSANVDARLGGSDSDLVYKFASLAAPVKKTVSQARLTAVNVFQPLVKLFDKENKIGGTSNQLPTAVRIDLISGVSSRPDGEIDKQFKVTSAATTSGALPPP